MEDYKFVMTGGGTGGHIYPAIAIAHEIENRKSEAKILFIGTKDRMEAVIVPREGYELQTITVSYLPRKISPKLLTFAPNLLKGIFQAYSILERFKPNAVVGTGGYVSGPVIIAAYFLRIPIIIIEENSLPGITTKFLARFATEIHLTFQESLKYFENKNNVFVSGNPVRKIESLSTEEAYEKWNLPRENKTLLVFGGSQGARGINIAMIDAVPKLPQNLNIILQTGKTDFDLVKGKLKNYKNVIVKEFIFDMNSAYKIADLVICRAGASTFAELTNYGLPAIFVPLPTAAENHQEYNAKSVVKAQGGRMIREKKLTPETLSAQINELLNDPSLLKEMSKNMKKLSKPNAAKIIVDHLFGIMQKKGE